jgi:hypothetical protein
LSLLDSSMFDKVLHWICFAPSVQKWLFWLNRAHLNSEVELKDLGSVLAIDINLIKALSSSKVQVCFFTGDFFVVVCLIFLLGNYRKKSKLLLKVRFFSGFSLGSVFPEKTEFSWTAGVAAPPPPLPGGWHLKSPCVSTLWVKISFFNYGGGEKSPSPP